MTNYETPYDALLWKERYELLKRAVRRIPLQRQRVWRAWAAGYTAKETAARLGLSRAYVYQVLHKAHREVDRSLRTLCPDDVDLRRQVVQRNLDKEQPTVSPVHALLRRHSEAVAQLYAACWLNNYCALCHGPIRQAFWYPKQGTWQNTITCKCLPWGAFSYETANRLIHQWAWRIWLSRKQVTSYEGVP